MSLNMMILTHYLFIIENKGKGEANAHEARRKFSIQGGTNVTMGRRLRNLGMGGAGLHGGGDNPWMGGFPPSPSPYSGQPWCTLYTCSANQFGQERAAVLEPK